MKRLLLFLVLVIPVLAYSQSVTTDAATNVSYEDLTLNASASSLVVGKTYYVKFGYSTSSPIDGSATFVQSSNFTATSGNTSTSFSVNISGLSSNTQYYFNVYMYESNFPSDSYVGSGSEDNETTLSPSAPSVTTGTDFSNTTYSSTENTTNEVLSNNGSVVFERGLAYSSSNSTPIITDNKKIIGSGEGQFDGYLSSLTQATKYYVRAYATNAIGTAYGTTVRSFTTEPETKASIVSMVSENTNELTINFNASSADETIIFMRETTQIIDYPADGSSYSANTAFGSGDDLGNGTYVVYAGSGAKGSITITNIDGTKDYYVDIADGAESGADRKYFYTIDQLNTQDDSDLPIDLIYFVGNNSDNVNTLNWATASEKNNHYFVIEKSTDLENFEIIGEVLGSGNSTSKKSYSLIDSDNNDIVYYRLSQVDFDGKTTVYDAITINKKAENQLNINTAYLNSEVLFINFTSASKADVNIYDINGKLLLSKKITSTGFNEVNIPFEYSNGTYLIQIISEGDIVTKKFVK